MREDGWPPGVNLLFSSGQESWSRGGLGGGGALSVHLKKQSDRNRDLPDGSCGHKGIRSSDKPLVNISFCFFPSHFTCVAHVEIQARY